MVSEILSTFRGLPFAASFFNALSDSMYERFTREKKLMQVAPTGPRSVGAKCSDIRNQIPTWHVTTALCFILCPTRQKLTLYGGQGQDSFTLEDKTDR